MRVILIWFFGVFLYAQIDLTLKEKYFLKTHSIKCVTTTKWSPFNMQNKGTLEGIAIDYYNLIKKSLNLQSECEIVNTWQEALQAVKEKKADMILATDITPSKEKYAIFTKPYETYPIVIATKNTVGFINRLSLIKNKTIVVGKDYSVAELLKKHYPYLKLKEVKDIKTALKMVSEKKAFAAIDTLPVISYNINKYQFSDLKISGKLPFDFQIRFMLRDDYKLLQNILNKAINNITQEQKDEIFNKWIYLKKSTFLEFKKILTLLLIFSGLVLILISVIIYQYFEIKKRKQFELKLIKTATIDSLTGLFNRKHIDYMLQKEVEEAKRYATPLSIIFCDIDHFKRINDKYGHQVGDDVLKELSAVMRRELRKSDIIGRWGGEEFLIILPNTHLKEALNVAKKLQNAIREHTFATIGHLTCSFGVTEFKKEDSIYKLMIRVDQALYEAKNTGRDKIVVKV